jgi:hypothetical protein
MLANRNEPEVQFSKTLRSGEGIPTCYEMNGGQQFTQNNEGDYQKVVSSFSTVLNFILLSLIGKPFRS